MVRKLSLIFLFFFSVTNLYAIDKKSLTTIDKVKNLKGEPIPNGKARIKVIRIKDYKGKIWKAKISINNGPVFKLKELEYHISDYPIGKLSLVSTMYKEWSYALNLEVKEKYEYIITAKAVGNMIKIGGFEMKLYEIIKP